MSIIFVKSIPKYKISVLSSLIVFEVDGINLTQKFFAISEGTENIVGKGKNCWSAAFSATKTYPNSRAISYNHVVCFEFRPF